MTDGGNAGHGASNAGQRGLGVVATAAIGIGGMVGGGIFAVLGTAVGLAGAATPVAFAIAGLVAILTAYSYARLAVHYPSAGGTVVFLDKAFGIDYVTGVLNLVLWTGYLVTIALYASAFGVYGARLVGVGSGGGSSSTTISVLVTLAIALPTLINILDATMVSRFETAIVVLKLALLAVVVVAGAFAVDGARLDPSHWPGPTSLITGGMVIFVAYEGFELMANAASDVEDPKRTLPRAFFGSVLFVVVLYILVSIVTVGSVAPEEIQRAKDYALAAAARPSLGATGFTMVAVSALLATFSAINATIYGNARLGFSLAKDGELPKLLARRTWSRPIVGVVMTAVLSLVLALSVDIESIAILGSAGFLLVFTAVNLAALRMSKTIGAKRSVTSIAALACLASLVALLVHAGRDNPNALLIEGAVLCAILLFEAIYPRLRGRTFDALAE
ncbi:MAG: amino acid permease [Planctomycetes bacterium]|nr:amino acid permease [Planctomycetota bacterium]